MNELIHITYQCKYLKYRYNFNIYRYGHISFNDTVAYISLFAQSESVLVKANSETGAPLAIYYFSTFIIDMYSMISGHDIVLGLRDTTDNSIKA